MEKNDCYFIYNSLFLDTTIIKIVIFSWLLERIGQKLSTNIEIQTYKMTLQIKILKKKIEKNMLLNDSKYVY